MKRSLNKLQRRLELQNEEILKTRREISNIKDRRSRLAQIESAREAVNVANNKLLRVRNMAEVIRMSAMNGIAVAVEKLGIIDISAFAQSQSSSHDRLMVCTSPLPFLPSSLFCLLI